MYLELTEEQIKAVRSLERAFRKCAKAKLYIHNCYGRLVAYDGSIVHHVDNDETEIPCESGATIGVPFELDLSMYADDAHYVHLHEES